MTTAADAGAARHLRTILFGGSGFLGSCILENYPGIISVGRTPPPTANRHIPIESLANLDALGDVEFDRVIYIIGNTDHQKLEKQSLERGEPTAFDYHVAPLIQTMEQLRHYPVRKLIHFSSILMYDRERLTMPVDEDAPVDPYTTRYVMSKHLAEELCRFYSRWVPTINIRLSNIYGPTKLQRNDIIHVLIRQLLTRKAGSVWTTKPRRDFIYIDDAAHAVVKLLDTDFTGTLNLGSGVATPISEIVQILRDVSGCPIDDEARDVAGPMEFRCDMSALKGLIDWEPRYSIDRGVRLTYDLMKQWLASRP